MPVDLETTKRIAGLSMLDPSLSGGDLSASAAWEKMASEVSTLIDSIDVLQQADTQGVEPLYTPMFQTLGPREDVPKVSEAMADIMEQAPSRVGNFFAVPKIV